MLEVVSKERQVKLQSIIQNDTERFHITVPKWIVDLLELEKGVVFKVDANDFFKRVRYTLVPDKHED